ncbi:MAG: carbon-nitrogen hydrolase family protein [Chloroflexi bacterium]|nr:carbon-nitrogen hydrolase family protein [Chloroflexota bacterium]
MPRTISVAATQMNAGPAPTSVRLARAEELVEEAQQAGAQIVVLPELFNSGYSYDDALYDRVETMDGPTVTWMKNTAKRFRVHLAGTLLLLDEEEIYNTLLLVAPDGELWRYDKVYPWFFERAFFHPGERITIADTVYGRIGLLICWDVGHPSLWARYAGKVDMMIVCASSPRMHDATILMPDGMRVRLAEGGPQFAMINRGADEIFGEDLRAQSAYLQVPVVLSNATGTFDSRVPLPTFSMTAFTALRPELWRYIRSADEARIRSGYFNESYIADAQGKVLGRVDPGAEGVVLSDITLPDSLPQPEGRQPGNHLPPFTPWLDNLFNSAMTGLYRRSVRALYGPQMAPVSPMARRFLAIALLVAAAAFWFGRITKRRQVKVIEKKVPVPVTRTPQERRQERATQLATSIAALRTLERLIDGEREK